jgi:hypothetical protein
VTFSQPPGPLHVSSRVLLYVVSTALHQCVCLRSLWNLAPSAAPCPSEWSHERSALSVVLRGFVFRFVLHEDNTSTLHVNALHVHVLPFMYPCYVCARLSLLHHRRRWGQSHLRTSGWSSESGLSDAASCDVLRMLRSGAPPAFYLHAPEALCWSPERRRMCATVNRH